MAISVEAISANPYAPEGSEKVLLYSTGLEGGGHLTIGQLAIAVAMRSAASYEAQGIVKMNRMSGGSDKLTKIAEFMEEIADGAAGEDWAAIKTYCVDVLGIDDENMPDAIDTYAKRMSAVDVLRTKASALTQQQQTDMIDLQSLVNRRDVAFSASSNIVRALGTSQGDNAANF